jgi:hypothetical protein
VNRIKLLLLGLGLTSTVVGCAADTDSENIRTSGVYADFEVLASTVQQGGADAPVNDIDVAANLRVDDATSNTWLDLTGEDKLLITAGDVTRTLTDDERTTNFPGTEDELDFTFAFMRGEEDDSAPDSTVTLPPSFVVQGMEGVDGEDPEITRSEGLELHLEDVGNRKVGYRIEGDCLMTQWGTLTANDGDITIPSGEFDPAPFDEEDPEDECTQAAGKYGAKLYVELVNEGSLDPAYNDGTIKAIRRVWVPFVSTP